MSLILSLILALFGLMSCGGLTVPLDGASAGANTPEYTLEIDGGAVISQADGLVQVRMRDRDGEPTLTLVFEQGSPGAFGFYHTVALELPVLADGETRTLSRSCTYLEDTSWERECSGDRPLDLRLSLRDRYNPWIYALVDVTVTVTRQGGRISGSFSGGVTTVERIMVAAGRSKDISGSFEAVALPAGTPAR